MHHPLDLLRASRLQYNQCPNDQVRLQWLFYQLQKNRHLVSAPHRAAYCHKDKLFYRWSLFHIQNSEMRAAECKICKKFSSIP